MVSENKKASIWSLYLLFELLDLLLFVVTFAAARIVSTKIIRTTLVHWFKGLDLILLPIVSAIVCLGAAALGAERRDLCERIRS